MLILTLLTTPQAFVPQAVNHPPLAQLQPSPPGDPLGHFESIGVPGSLSLPGDLQRISNPSFDPGTLAPWLQSQSNAANGSTITLTSPGYQDTTSAQLSVYSGNSSALSLASESTAGLTNDLTQQKVGFNPGTTFKIAVQVQAVSGTTGTDRVEASLALTTSTGNTSTIHYVFADGSSLPGNSTTDAYLKVPGFGTTGQWITVDRNLPADTAAVFSDAASIDSVQSITLTVHAQTLPGPPIVDPHIKYWESAGFGHWAFGEPVVYDTNNNGLYDSGETVVGCGYPNPCSPPPTGTPLAMDPEIKYVDPNHSGVWDCSATDANNVCTSGEPVVYDNDMGTTSGDGVYDYGEPVIIPPTPIPGTLLMKVVQAHTQALFDQVELHTAAGGYDWVLNGGLEAGLTGWYTNSSFTSATTPVHSGTKSVQVLITGGAAEMAQSIDARPQVNSTMTFKASANIATMTGTSTSDKVDLWLGLDDSQGNPLSLYYYFKTGTGTIQANRTDTIDLKVGGFGTTGQWLNITDNLLQRVQSAVLSNGLTYTAPYTLEVVVLEASASSSKTTTAYFDDISLGTPSITSPAPSYFYALDGLNTTYTYTAASIPQGPFSVDMPQGRALVNVTSPAGTTLQPGEYATTVSSGSIRVTVSNSTSFKYPPLGTWKIFTSSTNAISSVYAEDPASHAQAASINAGSTVNLVSQSKDPFNQPISNAPANLTLWNSNGVEVGPVWPGVTNSQGWWNVSSITLPFTSTPPETYTLQAAVLSVYPGIRTFQVAVRYIVTVDLSLSNSQPSAGQSITISGTVTRTDAPGPAQGVNVTISYRLAGNSQWTVLAMVKTDSSGKYTYNWNPPEGEYQVMASAGDTTTAPAQSTPAHLLVNPAGFLQGPWPIIIATVAAAAAVILIVFLLRRKIKVQAPKA